MAKDRKLGRPCEKSSKSRLIAWRVSIATYRIISRWHQKNGQLPGGMAEAGGRTAEGAGAGAGSRGEPVRANGGRGRRGRLPGDGYLLHGLRASETFSLTDAVGVGTFRGRD